MGELDQMRVDRDRLAETCEVLLLLLQEKQEELHKLTEKIREVKAKENKIQPL